MNKFDLLSKKASQKRVDAINDLSFSHYENAAAKGSTGACGAYGEMVFRHLASAHGIESEADAYVRKSGENDLTVYVRVDGKLRRQIVEIKTGGIYGYIKPSNTDTIDNHGVSDLFGGKDLVFYCPRFSEMESIDEILDETLVGTPEEIAEFIIANCGKRKHGFSTAFKLATNNSDLRAKNDAIPSVMVMDKKTGEMKPSRRGLPLWRDCIILQPAYLEQVIEAISEQYELLTLRAWLEENGRA